MSRRLKVKTLSNNIYELEVNPDLKISELKIEITKVSQVPVENQRLVYMGRLLKAEDPLSQYLKEDDQTILMMANTAPTNPQTPQ